MIEIREAKEADAAGLLAIYAPEMRQQSAASAWKNG